MRVAFLTCAGVLGLIAVSAGRAQIRMIEPSYRELPVGTAVIEGRVITDTGEPAAGAKLSIKASEVWSVNSETVPSKARTLVADSEGRFKFSGLPDEPLLLTASMPGFLPAAYGQYRPGLAGTPIRLADGQQLTVMMRLARGSAIVGRILDDKGRPAPGISVYAFRAVLLTDEEYVLGSDGSAITDADGSYRMADLSPGKYVVTAYRMWPNGDRSPILQLAPNSFVIESDVNYPDADDFESAEVIDVTLGQDQFLADMRLHMVPVTTISGVVRDIDGQPVANAPVRLFHPGPYDQVDDTMTGRDGSFTLSRVEAGDYEVATYSRRDEVRWSRSALRSDGRTPLRTSLILQPGATVHGRVVRADGSAAPPGVFSLFLSASGGDVFGVAPARATPEFTYTGVPPGRYVITVNRESLPAGWRMRSVMVDGRDALDEPFEIKSAERREVLITLSDQVTEVAGRVIEKNGAIVTNCPVVVFAADQRFWTSGSRRIETRRPDTNGRYIFRGLPPGDYIVAAGDPDQFGTPGPSVLRHLIERGARLTLREGEKQTVDVRR